MKPARVVWTRVGRRGASLLFLALLDFVYASALMTGATSSPSIGFVGRLLPMPVWGALWGAVGLLCLAQAFARTDRLAFGAASLIKVLWGSMLLLGWAVGAIPRGYVSAAVWLAFAAWVAVISGWREPTRGP